MLQNEYDSETEADDDILTVTFSDEDKPQLLNDFFKIYLCLRDFSRLPITKDRWLKYHDEEGNLNSGFEPATVFDEIFEYVKTQVFDGKFGRTEAAWWALECFQTDNLLPQTKTAYILLAYFKHTVLTSLKVNGQSFFLYSSLYRFFQILPKNELVGPEVDMVKNRFQFDWQATEPREGLIGMTVLGGKNLLNQQSLIKETDIDQGMNAQSRLV